MPERFEDAVKALRHVARGNGMVMRIADRIEAAHERELAAAVEGRRTAPERPITRGLRDKLMEYEPTRIGAGTEVHVMGQTGYDRMVQLCDDVDSVHARLEDEHAALVFKYETIAGSLRRIGEAMRDDDGRA